MASRVVAALSVRDTLNVMHFVIEKVLPFLDAIDDESKREGAIEAIASILSLIIIKTYVFGLILYF